MSRAADIPTGWEITLDLIRRLAVSQGVEDQSDWAAWYRKQTGKEPEYSDLLEGLASSPDERRSILHSYIEPTEEEQQEGKKVPTAAHHAIAELVHAGYVRVIVTTNFDRLIENALREVGVEPTIIASPDALSGAEPLTHTDCYILKLHGDYKDARILNTEAELSEYPPQYDSLLDRIFDEHGLIVCGWSGEWDQALRTALLRAPNRRYGVYWTSHGGLSEVAQKLIEHRDAQVIEINDADEFFSGLRQRVQTLESTHRQNPLSVEMVVQTCKRYLSKPEYRIQLDELISGEVNRLASIVQGSEFNPQTSWSVEGFQSRVTGYEAATEILARTFGVIGRWGDGSELPWVLDIIRAIYLRDSAPVSGLTLFIDLRTYPALLMFTAYGLGLTRAGRWEALHGLLTAHLSRQHDGKKRRLVDKLFSFAWDGSDVEAWRNLEGLDRRHTPLNDHLCELFRDWGKSFLGITEDFELLFERFEILASLSFIEKSDVDTIKANLENAPPNNWYWIPIGRSGWHSQTRDHIFVEIQDSELKDELIRAGFANSCDELLELFIENFTRIAGRMEWR
jgi:hypothetical protein